jgi:ribonuclease BN (tRNA processing enzyme)
MTADRLKGTGVSVADVSAVCLTHLDRDHFNPNWVNTWARLGVRVFCHASRAEDLLASAREACRARPDFGKTVSKLAEAVVPFEESFEPLPGVSARAVALSHDVEGSHGFVLEGHGSRIGYATDLGHVPGRLLEALEAVDVLALESNYDPQMQRDSGRPWFLQRRITGGRGHLSNEQAFEAVRTVLDRRQRRRLVPPDHIVLLHRSRQCNCPHLLRRMFERDVRIAPRLTLAEPFERSAWLTPQDRRPFTGEQMLLAWG